MRRKGDGRSRVLESQDAVELLAPKWRSTRVHLLRYGSLRTSELQSAVEEVSAKVLTQTLHAIERDGLIERNLRPVALPQVEYGLTEMGATYSFRSRTCVMGRRPTFLNAQAGSNRYDSLKLDKNPRPCNWEIR
jgi:DNA-binding HxlR family transcriptional regulator